MYILEELQALGVFNFTYNKVTVLTDTLIINYIDIPGFTWLVNKLSSNGPSLFMKRIEAAIAKKRKNTEGVATSVVTAAAVAAATATALRTVAAVVSNNVKNVWSAQTNTGEMLRLLLKTKPIVFLSSLLLTSSTIAAICIFNVDFFRLVLSIFS